MVNQFSPTGEEIQKIIENNKLLPQLEKTCYRCGHKPCASCEDWCDTLLYNVNTQANWISSDIEDVDDKGNVSPPCICCDGVCSYE